MSLPDQLGAINIENCSITCENWRNFSGEFVTLGQIPELASSGSITVLAKNWRRYLW